MVTGRSYLTLVVDNTNRINKRKRQCSFEYKMTIFDRIFEYIADMQFSTCVLRTMGVIFGGLFILFVFFT